MISLQSGTAWAISSCASRLDRPNSGAINSTFGTNNPNTSQQQNRDFVESVTDVTQASITSALDAFGPLAGNYPDGDMGTEVQRAEIMHLLVTNGSCWASYCAGSINSMDAPVTIENDSSPSFCNKA